MNLFCLLGSSLHSDANLHIHCLGHIPLSGVSLGNKRTPLPLFQEVKGNEQQHQLVFDRHSQLFVNLRKRTKRKRFMSKDSSERFSRGTVLTVSRYEEIAHREIIRFYIGMHHFRRHTNLVMVHLNNTLQLL